MCREGRMGCFTVISEPDLAPSIQTWMSVFLLTFFPVEGAVHSGKRASPSSCPSVWRCSTWSSRSRSRLNTALTSSSFQRAWKTSFFLPSKTSPPTERKAALVKPKRSESKFWHLLYICFPQRCDIVITHGGCLASGVEANTLRVHSNMAAVQTGGVTVFTMDDASNDV